MFAPGNQGNDLFRPDSSLHYGRDHHDCALQQSSVNPSNQQNYFMALTWKPRHLAVYFRVAHNIPPSYTKLEILIKQKETKRKDPLLIL